MFAAPSRRRWPPWLARTQTAPWRRRPSARSHCPQRLGELARAELEGAVDVGASVDEREPIEAGVHELLDHGQVLVFAHGIAEIQTFIDSNKRLGLVAMLTFSKSTATASRLPIPSSRHGAWS